MRQLASIAGADPSKPFSFADYPLTREAIKGLQSRLNADINTVIMSGTSEEWKESNLVQDLVARKVLKAYTGTDRAGEEYTRYFQTNPAALEAFQKRRDGGMNLSDRVWNLSEEYRVELEDAISAAIAPGQSAQALSMEVRKCLNEPDLMFRRFRYKNEEGIWKRKWKKRYTDDEGNVRFIDCDRDSYRNQWTGPGYYKSAAKNAMRLARTEINMAYRTAEQKRWEQFDFVVGYEVKTTQNGHHVEDICDRLAGKYPKDFKFTGWHPQCMCYCIPILKTEDEFWAYDPENPQRSANEITDVPSNFKDWIKDNSERIEAAEKRGKLPYFIRDNREDVEEILNPKENRKTPLEIAAERHAERTQEDIRRIKESWSHSRERAIDSEISNLQDSMSLQYSESIEQILQGNELKGRGNKAILLKYMDALETLDNGTPKAILDHKLRTVYTSDEIRDGLNNGYYSNSDIKHILSVIKTNVTDRVSRLSFVPQLKDLFKLKTFDASGLPLEWKKEYLNVLKGLPVKPSTIFNMSLDSSKEANLGAYGINMIDLSRNKLAQKFGLSNLSSKTPVQLFTDFEKAIPGYSDSLKTWRSKEFFDSLKYFTPLKTDLNKGCFHQRNGKYGFVHINPTEADTKKRLGSDFYKKSILSHEYGHAMFHQYDWINDVDIKAVYDKWVRAVNANNGKNLIDKINKKLIAIPPSEQKYGFDVYEQLGKLSDSAQAAITDHPWIDPMGHNSGATGYFSTYEKQLNEIIAHSSENLWIGNPIFEEIAPGLYKKMRELLAKKLAIKP